MQRALLWCRAPARLAGLAAALLSFSPAVALLMGARAVPSYAATTAFVRSAGVAAPVTWAAPPPTFDELADRCDAESTQITGTRACRAAAFDYLLTKGLSREQAAGVVGNLWVESNGVSPKSRQFNGGPGRGIAQWTYNQRWLGVLALAQARDVNPYTLRVQLDYLWHELTSTYKEALVAVRAAPTLPDATFAFQNKFEVPIGTPVGVSVYAPNGHPWAHTGERVQHALAVHVAHNVAEWRPSTTPLTPSTKAGTLPVLKRGGTSRGTATSSTMTVPSRATSA